MSNSFGVPYDRQPLVSNVVVQQYVVSVAANATTATVPEVLTAGNFLLLINGTFNTSYTLTGPNTISFTGNASARTFTFIVFANKFGYGFRNRVGYQHYASPTATINFPVGFVYDPAALQVYVNGVLRTLGASGAAGWSQVSNTNISIPNVTTGTPATVFVMEMSEQTGTVPTVPWNYVTGKPNIPDTSAVSQTVLDGINNFKTDLNSASNGQGSSLVRYNAQYSVSQFLTFLKTELDKKVNGISFDAINKAGDTGIGPLTGESFALSAKNRLFYTFYNSPSDFAGMKSNSLNELVFMQGPTGFPRDTFIIKEDDVWHRTIGNFKDHFMPRTGMQFNGIGSHGIAEIDALDGEVVTPEGWIGSWRCISMIRRGRPGRMALFIRIA